MEIRRKFSQRRRAKDAAIALDRLPNRKDIKLQVLIEGPQLHHLMVEVADPTDEFLSLLTGLLVHGEEDQWIDPQDCVEFYQGEGLSRFRAV